ncbi:hypothetical protein [Methylophaga sp. OBS4]|uniref:hypothetical protein n=1 Tax=Methylophaga sp. OBS4 TaxID=2991935 RepID=UPI00225C1AF5|nr:hypothetical protein [Methylophaga sp. OBS4]MCX4186727.1 hypothetical protein [Methylophaga sp. OBS4]
MKKKEPQEFWATLSNGPEYQFPMTAQCWMRIRAEIEREHQKQRIRRERPINIMVALFIIIIVCQMISGI